MGLFDWIGRLFGGDDDPMAAVPRDPFADDAPPADAPRDRTGPPRSRQTTRSRDRRRVAPRRGGQYGVSALTAMLDRSLSQCRAVPIRYQPRRIPKADGTHRTLHVPNAELKALQRRILRRLLAPLTSHPAACGFERGRSIVHHANEHAGKALVMTLDIRDFFPATSADRVHRFFRGIGWDQDAAQLLTAWTTHDGGLPQGAPTSPRLSNLVNHKLDARLHGIARKVLIARYSRYADDLAFSFSHEPYDGHIGEAIRLIKSVLDDFGYQLHPDKLRIMRRGNQQRVCGLVVNQTTNLPRRTRRRLRAIRHQQSLGRPTTLSPSELAGWDAYELMIDLQRQED